MTGRYRVLSGRDADEWCLLDPETGERSYAAREMVGGDGTGVAEDDAPAHDASEHDAPEHDAPERVSVGNVVRADLDWSTQPPQFASLAVEDATTFAFTRGATDLFQAALDCMQAAERAGDAMRSALTRDTDGEVNGVLYVFAKQRTRDLVAEFRDGSRPLDPLVDRVDAVDPPYAVFVIEPAREPFVVVYIALERDGLLARTVRETYFEDSDATESAGAGGLADLDAFEELEFGED